MRMSLSARNAEDAAGRYVMSAASTSVRTRWQARFARASAALVCLYWLPVLLFCGWILWLPVFPSQDGPLHLYYANVLHHLLLHQPGVYLESYTLKSPVTPYAAYYYGLLALGSMVSLETAEKILVCLCIVAFAGASRFLLRVVGGDATWSGFLVLPVVLSWPLCMGFVNYVLSTCMALCAIAIWCSGADRPGLRSRAVFLLLIAGMTVTHPVPWMLTVSFALLEVASRLVRHWSPRYREAVQPAMRCFVRDGLTVLLACTPYLYIRRFSHAVQTLEPSHVDHDPQLVRMLPAHLLELVERAQAFLKTLGIDVFAGDDLLPQIYRVGIRAILLCALAVGLWAFAVRRRRGEWAIGHLWMLFTLALIPVLLFLPDPFQDRYFFATRMGIVLYVGSIAAASPWFVRGRWPARITAGFAYVLSLLTFGLAVRYITPAARDIATLRQAPGVAVTTKPGLSMVTVGNGPTPNLSFQPDNWATAHYFRWHDLLLYNTAWLGDPIILVGVRPETLQRLDTTYFESVPWYTSRMLPDDDAMEETLRKVGFVLLMRQNASLEENPFATDDERTDPGAFARDWRCMHTEEQAWYLCQREAGFDPDKSTPKP